MLGSIFGTSRPRGTRLSTGQLITRQITRSMTNQVAGQIAANIGKSIGGSMGSSVGRAIVRGTMGQSCGDDLRAYGGGRTRRDKADEYQQYWLAHGSKPLLDKGSRSVQMLREDRERESEFVTISYWNSIADMGAGPDPTRTHHLHARPRVPHRNSRARADP